VVEGLEARRLLASSIEGTKVFALAGKDANAVAAETAGEVGQDFTFVLQLHAEKPAGKLLQNGSGYFNTVFFTHRPPGLSGGGPERVAMHRTISGDTSGPRS
jgi:ABC-type lipoprotein export system ATPase subunit